MRSGPLWRSANVACLRVQGGTPAPLSIYLVLVSSCHIPLPCGLPFTAMKKSRAKPSELPSNLSLAKKGELSTRLLGI